MTASYFQFQIFKFQFYEILFQVWASEESFQFTLCAEIKLPAVFFNFPVKGFCKFEKAALLDRRVNGVFF